MKYLDYDLYEKVCSPHCPQSIKDEWQIQFEKYNNEQSKTYARLPRNFVSEYEKHSFHDNDLISFIIERKQYQTDFRYDIIMEVTDYHDPDIVHKVTFKNVEKYKTTMEDLVGLVSWLHAELLIIDEKLLSMEILFVAGTMYFEFTKLHYKKINLKKATTERDAQTKACFPPKSFRI